MFLDKDEYQKYVDMLSPEFINQLEINISEQILENYKDARDIVARRREEYYLKKNLKARQEIYQKGVVKTAKRSAAQLELDRKHQKLVKKAIVQKYFTDEEGHITRYPTCLNKKKMSRHKSEIRMVSQPTLSLGSSEKHIVTAQKKGYSIDLTKKQYKASIFGDISEGEYYKLKHPESKIIPLSQGNERAKDTEDILADQQKHRTKSFDKKPRGTLKRFYMAYSSGPFRGKKSEAVINAENRDRAAIILQKAWRGYLGRKAVKYKRMLNIESLVNKIRSNAVDKTAGYGSQSMSKADSKKPTLKKSNTLFLRQDTRKVVFANEPSGQFNAGATNVFGESNSKMEFMRQKSGVDLASASNISQPQAIKSRPTSFGTKSNPKPKNKEELDEFGIEVFNNAVEENDLEALMKTDARFLRKLINSPNSDKVYPIQRAIEHKNLDMVIFMLENGLNLTKCNLTEEKVLEIVKGKGFAKIREYLLMVFKQKYKKKYEAASTYYFQVD